MIDWVPMGDNNSLIIWYKYTGPELIDGVLVYSNEMIMIGMYVLSANKMLI